MFDALIDRLSRQITFDEYLENVAAVLLLYNLVDPRFERIERLKFVEESLSNSMGRFRMKGVGHRSGQPNPSRLIHAI